MSASGNWQAELAQSGVKPGDVVAVLDWDTNRYHECYFAIPMMGAVLQTLNPSLAPEALAYTLNDTVRNRPAQYRFPAAV